MNIELCRKCAWLGCYHTKSAKEEYYDLCCEMVKSKDAKLIIGTFKQTQNTEKWYQYHNFVLSKAPADNIDLHSDFQPPQCCPYYLEWLVDEH